MVRITNDISIDADDVSSLVFDRGSDNFTLGLTITMKNGDKHYVRHNAYSSVYDVERKIVDARTK